MLKGTTGCECYGLAAYLVHITYELWPTGSKWSSLHLSWWYYLIYVQQEVSDTNYFADESRGLNICQDVRMHLVICDNLIPSYYMDIRR